MDFRFTEEQQLLADSAARFYDDSYDLPRRRERTASDIGFSTELWSSMAELGWFALRLPERFGGFDGGAVESALIVEASGKALAVEPLVATGVIGATAISLGADDALGEDLGPKLAAGECRFALAQAEPKSRYSFNVVDSTASKDGDGYVLSGAKAVVAHAASADKLLVTARTAGARNDADGVTLFLVDAKSAGLSMRSYPTIDGLRAAEVELENVRAEAVLGEVDNGVSLLQAIVDEAQVALSAEAVGAMSHLLNATVEYAKTRKQFEQTLSSFQVIQHRLVDMYNAIETARAMTYYAAAGLASGDTTARTKLALQAKVKASQASQLVGEDSVQIHGGMGMTDELDVGHYFKRITMIAQTFGDVDHQLKRLAALTRA